MKQCCECKETKPTSEFSKNASRSDGLQSKCKKCKASYNRQYYGENKTYFRDKNKEIKVRNAKHVKEILEKSKGCFDCGESNFILLDFDHDDAEGKRSSVSAMVHDGYGIAAIEEEISKCTIRCANCHRIRTAVQFGWYGSLSV